MSWRTLLVALLVVGLAGAAAAVVGDDDPESAGPYGPPSHPPTSSGRTTTRERLIAEIAAAKKQQLRLEALLNDIREELPGSDQKGALRERASVIEEKLMDFARSIDEFRQRLAALNGDPAFGTCGEPPPPFEATYLPDGFSRQMREGAGLFKGTNYPTEGLLGHYLGEHETVHVNFQVRGGPLPYIPAAPRPIDVLGHPGAIGSIEGGWSVEFSNDDCDFRMDTYGISRADTVAIAKGLRATRTL